MISIVGSSALALTAAAIATGSVARIDSAFVDAPLASPSGPLADVARAATGLGGADLPIMVAALGLVLLGVLRQWRGLLTLVLAFAVTNAAVHALKLLVARPRPSEAIIDASGFSFPSGHAAIGVAVYGLLTLLAARACRGPARVAVAAVGGAVALSVGASRVVLGVHYPSDVIAGWLLAGAIALAAWLVAERIRASAARLGAGFHRRFTRLPYNPSEIQSDEGGSG